MSWSCVIVDDEKPARERVKKLLADHEAFDVIGEASDVPSAIETIDSLKPDLCFLDVRMPGGDGFDVVAALQHRPQVVFTTAYDEYALKAFEVHSIDYLLKPFTKARFAEALDVIRQTMGSDEPNDDLLEAIRELKQDRAAQRPKTPARVTAKRGAKILVLAPNEIRWFEAEETLVFAQTAGGRVLIERTLADLEETMGPSFFRCHRRYLVNLAFIREIVPCDAGTYELVMRDEDSARIPLSRRQARKLRELIPW